MVEEAGGDDGDVKFNVGCEVFGLSITGMVSNYPWK